MLRVVKLRINDEIIKIETLKNAKLQILKLNL